MTWFKRVWMRGRLYSDLAEEIQQHLHEKTEALIAGGMSRHEAERVARREFGNVTRGCCSVFSPLIRSLSP